MNKTVVFFNKQTEKLLFAITVLRADYMSDVELATWAFIMSMPVLCGQDWLAAVCRTENVQICSRADSGYGSANHCSSCNSVGNPLWN